MTIPTTRTQPGRTQVVRIWRQNRCLRAGTIGAYLLWVRRFKAYCSAEDLKEVRSSPWRASIPSRPGMPATAASIPARPSRARAAPCGPGPWRWRCWAVRLPHGNRHRNQEHGPARYWRNSRRISPGIEAIRR